jgi:hypothetical protein
VVSGRYTKAKRIAERVGREDGKKDSLTGRVLSGPGLPVGAEDEIASALGVPPPEGSDVLPYYDLLTQAYQRAYTQGVEEQNQQTPLGRRPIIGTGGRRY